MNTHIKHLENCRQQLSAHDAQFSAMRKEMDELRALATGALVRAAAAEARAAAAEAQVAALRSEAAEAEAGATVSLKAKVSVRVTGDEVGLPISANASTIATLEEHCAEHEEPTLHRDAILQAIKWKDTASALQLLRTPSPPGLNDCDSSWYNMSLLHRAIYSNLPEVSEAIARHREFQQVNAKDSYAGATALHLAAFHGYVEVCSALLARPDFREFKGQLCTSSWCGRTGDTAIDIARRHNQTEVIHLLQGF